MKALARFLTGLVLFAAGIGVGLYLAQRTPPPVLASLSTNRARPGETMILRGDGFDPDRSRNKVFVGEKQAVVQRAGAHEIEIVVPIMPASKGDEMRVGVRVVTGDRESGLLPLDIGPAIQVVEERVAPPAGVATSRPTPAPSPTPAKSPTAARSPGRPTPKRAAGRPTPTPASPASGADTLMGEASRAVEAKEYEKAVRLYTDALAIDPENAAAESRRAQVIEMLGATRRFVPGETSVANTKEKREAPKGFDPGDVAVKQTGEVPGSLEFDISPPQVKPGAPYGVLVYLKNEGQKGIRVDAVVVASTVNGVRSVARVSSKARDIGARGRSLLVELPGVWKKDVTSWSMEVLVTSSRGDVYRSSVTWR